MLLVVAPLDHRYKVPTDEVSVTLPPAQRVVEPVAVIVGVSGNGFIAIVVAADGRLRQPSSFIVRTVNSPAPETVIDLVVSPFDHRYELPTLEVSVWLAPAQMLTAPDGVIVG